MNKRLVLSLVCCVLAHLSYAQAPIQFTLEGANSTKVGVTTNGRLFWDDTKGNFSGAEGVDMLQVGGLWLSGFDPSGNLKGAIQEYNATENSDFKPGLIDPNTQEPFAVNEFWRVTEEEINNHLLDFEDNGVIDNPQEAIFGWPGRDNHFFEQYNDFPLPSTFSGLAPFWDNNGNGIYNPDDGDYPIVEIRGCGAQPIIPAEMVWFGFNDFGAHSSGMLSLNVEVHATVFTFACDNEQGIDNSVFVRYKIINRGTEPLVETRAGFLTAFSVGCPNNDYLGTNTDWNLVYGYNSEATDEACGLFDGLVSPPAVVATKFLRGPFNELGQELGLSSIMPIYYNSPSLPPAMRAPSTPTEYYNYLSGTWRDGSELMVGGNGYQSDGATTTFAFPDLPSEAGGWSERAAGLPAGERTALGAYGPFELQPGAINEFTVFFNIADNPNAATIDDQIDQLFSNIDGAQQLYDNCFALDTEFNCFATSIQEQIARNESLELFPNPAREQVHLQLHQGTIEQVRLLGMDGKMLQQFSATNGLIEQIDIAHLRVGVYIVQVVTSEGKWANQKLVISR